MGPQDYQDALDAVNSPDAPPAVKAAAKRLVERYSSALAGAQLKGRTSDSLAESSSLGPTGLDALAAAGLQPAEDPAERERQIQASEAKHPGIARALSLRTPSMGPTIPGANENDVRRAMGTGLDAQLPNASKRPELNEPPEWHPPTPAAPAASFDSVWGKLNAVKQAMPDWAGGGTEHYVEPSLEQFQKEMAPVLGPEVVMHADTNSDAYRSYADMKYRQALQAAQANGHGIVRDAFVKQDAIDAIPGALTKAGNVLRSGALGADDAITGGAAGTGAYMPHLNPFEEPSPLTVESVKEQIRVARGKKALDQAYSPLASDVGFALGALNPNSVGNLAGAPVARALGAAPGAFAGAAATTLAHDVPGVLLGEQGAGDALQRATFSGLAGAPLGIIGGALGNAAGEEGATLRQTTPLGGAEAGGARMRSLRGVDKGATNRGLEARARANDIGSAEKPDVEGMLASDLREPVAARIQSRRGELEQQAQPLRDFEDAFAGDKIPLPNTIRAILDAKKKLVLSDGTVSDPAAMRQLDMLLAKVASVSPQAHAPAPIDPERVAQFDRAVDLHGFDAMAPENFRRDVEQISTPTRPITPEGNRAAPTPREAGDTAVDLFGPFSEGLPNMREGIAAGGAGERLRTLHEARAANPNTFDITPEQASERGLDVGMDELGRPNFARVAPAGRNPGDVRKLSAAMEAEHRSGSTAEQPFPDYEKIRRAFHQDRDAFRGETGAIKQSDTFQLDNGQTVRGYSAANAQLANDIGENDNLLELLGLKKAPSADDTAAFQAFESKVRGFGKGGRSPEVDRAIRQMVGEAGAGGTLDQMTRYRAMRALEQRSKLLDALRFWSHPEAARLRADPVLQALIGPLQRAGSLGALPGEVHDQGQLPPQADQPTLDEIQRLLDPSAGLVQSPVEAKKNIQPVDASVQVAQAWRPVVDELDRQQQMAEMQPAFSMSAPPVVPGRGVDLRAARGYSYEYRDPNVPGAAPGRHVGPMAHNLRETAAAGTVIRDPRTGMDAVDTPRLTMVNTAALSEQQRRIDELERQLAAMASDRPSVDTSALDAAYARQVADTGVRSDRRSKKNVRPMKAAY